MGIFKLKKKESADAHQLKKQKIEADRKRIYNDNFRFDVKESYKDLRTNIIFSLSKKGCKKILLTSSIASEGKSTTCLNTAIAFAEMGAKILVIDCDMRKPNVANIMNQNNDIGLSNILVNEVDADKAIKHTDFKTLDLITAGNIPPNPTELLSSENMQALVDALSTRYDYILFDTPPVNLVSDAVIISKIVDGVVVVSKQNFTEKKFITDTINKLRFADAKIIGIVFNGVESAKTGYGNYEYR